MIGNAHRDFGRSFLEPDPIIRNLLLSLHESCSVTQCCNLKVEKVYGLMRTRVFGVGVLISSADRIDEWRHSTWARSQKSRWRMEATHFNNTLVRWNYL